MPVRDTYQLFSELPAPVLAVGCTSLRIHYANRAAFLLLGPKCREGEPVASLFLLDGGEEPPLIKAVKALSTLEPNTSRSLHDFIPVSWNESHDASMLSVAKLVYHEQTEGHEAKVFFSIDPGKSEGLFGLRRFIDNFPEMVWLKDAEARFIFCNKAFIQLCGLPLAHMVGKRMEELDVGEDITALLGRFDIEALRTGLPAAGETSGPLGRNEVCHFEHFSYPDRAVDGMVQGVFSLCIDISLRKTSELALARQSSLLKAANDAALILFADDASLDELAASALRKVGMACNADRVVVWRNFTDEAGEECCTKVFGWVRESSAAFATKNVDAICYERDIPGLYDLLRIGKSINSVAIPLPESMLRVISGRKLTSVFLIPIILPTGFYGFVSMGLCCGDNDWSEREEELLRSVGLFVATTKLRRQMQRKLEESETRFKDVAQAAGEVVWELNSSGYYTYLSGKIEDVTGYTEADLLGKRWEDLDYDGADSMVTGRMFESALATGTFRLFEHPVRAKNGEQLWLRTSGKLLKGAEGITGLRGTSLDVTENKQNARRLTDTLEALEKSSQALEESARYAHHLAWKAEAANRAKSNFIANVSHEIRTPLNAIMGMAYLLQQSSLTEKQSGYIEKLQGGGRRLLGLFDDILTFAETQSGEAVFKKDPFHLATGVDALAIVIGGKAKQKGLSFTVSMPPDLPSPLYGDERRLLQALDNVLDNAVKFTEQGSIRFSCDVIPLTANNGTLHTGNGMVWLRFTIQDTGIGIPTEQQKSIFDGFTQGDASTTRKYGGTGVGLALVKSVVETMQGRLELKSEPGKGTQVVMELPLSLHPDREETQDEMCPGVDGGRHGVSSQVSAVFSAGTAPPDCNGYHENSVAGDGWSNSYRSFPATVEHNPVATSSLSVAGHRRDLSLGEREALERRLATLMQLLQDADAACREFFAELRPKLLLLIPEADQALDAAANALEVFDFDQAYGHLVTVKKLMTGA